MVTISSILNQLQLSHLPVSWFSVLPVFVFCITFVFPLHVWISCQIFCVCCLWSSLVFCPCFSCHPSCTWFSFVQLDFPQPELCFLPFVHWIKLCVVKACVLFPQPAVSCLASRSSGTELNKDILCCQLRVNSRGMEETPL